MKNKEEHIDLMLKVLSGNASDTERAALEQLMAPSDELRDEYAKLEKLWHDTAGFTPRPSVDKQAAWKKIQDRIDLSETKVTSAKPAAPVGKSVRMPSWVWAAAAAVIAFAIFIFAPDQMQEFSGQVTPLAVLDDGSSVQLDESSQVIFEENQDHRLVELKGKATFDVQRNESKPFIVQTETYKLEVLGTSFEMQGNADSSFVHVLSGIVKVRSFDGDEEVLYKGDQWWSEKGVWNLKRAPESQVQWQFEDLPIDQVVESLESVYWKRIEVSESISNCRLSAKMSKANLEDVLQTIELTLGVQSSLSGDTIYLDGDGCY